MMNIGVADEERRSWAEAIVDEREWDAAGDLGSTAAALSLAEAWLGVQDWVRQLGRTAWQNSYGCWAVLEFETAEAGAEIDAGVVI